MFSWAKGVVVGNDTSSSKSSHRSRGSRDHRSGPKRVPPPGTKFPLEHTVCPHHLDGKCPYFNNWDQPYCCPYQIHMKLPRGTTKHQFLHANAECPRVPVTAYALIDVSGSMQQSTSEGKERLTAAL